MTVLNCASQKRDFRYVIYRPSDVVVAERKKEKMIHLTKEESQIKLMVPMVIYIDKYE
jgi:hypothetical protein